MSSWRLCLKLVPMAAACAVLGAPGTAHASQEAAKRYFQNGVELITEAQPNYQDAFYQFQLAYQESAKSWKVLGNLGLCALKLERDQEAAAYYEQYLQKGGSEIAPEERSAIEQDLLLLRGNLAVVRITSPVSDLKVVDHRSGSQAPPQSYSLKDGVLELKLRAGSHNLTASSGDRRLAWDVVLEPKGSMSHVFDFDAKVEAPPAPPPAAVAAPAPELSPSHQSDTPQRRGTDLRIPAFIAIGVGAVGIGVGGYFLWQTSDYSKKSDDAFACNSRVPSCTEPEKAEVRRLDGETSSARTRAIVSFSVGGAALATGIVLLAVSGGSPSSDSAHTASVTPWVGFREVGVSGRF